jgi:hypothetical protein
VKIVKRFSRASITFYRIGLTSKLKSEWNRFRGAIIQFGRRKKNGCCWWKNLFRHWRTFWLNSVSYATDEFTFVSFFKTYIHI